MVNHKIFYERTWFVADFGPDSFASYEFRSSVHAIMASSPIQTEEADLFICSLFEWIGQIAYRKRSTCSLNWHEYFLDWCPRWTDGSMLSSLVQMFPIQRWLGNFRSYFSCLLVAMPRLWYTWLDSRVALNACFLQESGRPKVLKGNNCSHCPIGLFAPPKVIRPYNVESKWTKGGGGGGNQL